MHIAVILGRRKLGPHPLAIAYVGIPSRLMS